MMHKMILGYMWFGYEGLDWGLELFRKAHGGNALWAEPGGAEKTWMCEERRKDIFSLRVCGARRDGGRDLTHMYSLHLASPTRPIPKILLISVFHFLCPLKTTFSSNADLELRQFDLPSSHSFNPSSTQQQNPPP